MMMKILGSVPIVIRSIQPRAILVLTLIVLCIEKLVEIGNLF